MATEVSSGEYEELGEGVLDTELEPPRLQLTADQAIRAFIFKYYCCSGEPSAIHGPIFVENLEHMFKWMKDGSVPEISRTERKRAIALVPKGE